MQRYIIRNFVFGSVSVLLLAIDYSLSDKALGISPIKQLHRRTHEFALKLPRRRLHQS